MLCIMCVFLNSIFSYIHIIADAVAFFVVFFMFERKVHVCLKMVGISLFENEFDLMFSEQLFSVIHKVNEIHGGTTHSIQLWKEEVEPSSILRDMNATLGDLVRSSSSYVELGDGDIPKLTLFYDFSPPDDLCPLLNARCS